MKKVLSLFLVIALTLTLGISAFAADGDKAVVTEGTEAGTVTPQTFDLVKEYQVNGGTVAPNETVTFDVEQISGIATVDLMVDDAVMTNTDDDMKAPFALTFGEYTKVGIYVYKITEVAPSPKTLGVTYDNSIIYVVVTITNIEQATMKAASSDNLLEATVAVHRVLVDSETQEPTDDNKIDPTEDSAFINQYDLGQLTVTKEVSGNLADHSKPFTIHITFTDGSGLTQGNPVSYTLPGETEQKTVTLGASKTIDVELKDGDSVVFTNIPAGAEGALITYTVEEDSVHTSVPEGETKESSDEGYDVEYTFSDSKKEITAEDEDTVTVENEKSTPIQTGIFLDSLPYILIGVAVVAVAVVMIIRKKRQSDDD